MTIKVFCTKLGQLQMAMVCCGAPLCHLHLGDYGKVAFYFMCLASTSSLAFCSDLGGYN